MKAYIILDWHSNFVLSATKIYGEGEVLAESEIGANCEDANVVEQELLSKYQGSEDLEIEWV